jgi:hypothetical protein
MNLILLCNQIADDLNLALELFEDGLWAERNDISLLYQPKQTEEGRVKTYDFLSLKRSMQGEQGKIRVSNTNLALHTITLYYPILWSETRSSSDYRIRELQDQLQQSKIPPKKGVTNHAEIFVPESYTQDQVKQLMYHFMHLGQETISSFPGQK